MESSILDLNKPIAGTTGTRIHDPKPVLQLMAQGAVGMPKKKHIDLSCFGVGNCVAISTLYTPQVAVGEKKLFAGQSDLAFQRLGSPAITVTGHTTDRQARIDIRQHFSVLEQISQVNDLVWEMSVNG